VRLTPKQRDAMVWLGEPATAEHIVTDEMIRELATLGIIDHYPVTGNVRFTPAGAQEFRYTVGHSPRRNIDPPATRGG
jgi:hypothetical protein